jgi:hypothetical protein
MAHLFRDARFTHRLRAAETARHHAENTPGRGIGHVDIEPTTDVHDKTPREREEGDGHGTPGRGGRT